MTRLVSSFIIGLTFLAILASCSSEGSEVKTYLQTLDAIDTRFKELGELARSRLDDSKKNGQGARNHVEILDETLVEYDLLAEQFPSLEVPASCQELHRARVERAEVTRKALQLGRDFAGGPLSSGGRPTNIDPNRLTKVFTDGAALRAEAESSHQVVRDQRAKLVKKYHISEVSPDPVDFTVLGF